MVVSELLMLATTIYLWTLKSGVVSFERFLSVKIIMTVVFLVACGVHFKIYKSLKNSLVVAD